MVQVGPLASKIRAGARLRVRARVTLAKVGYAVLLAIVLLAFLAPFVWMILNSLKTPLQISQTPPDLVFTPTLANYANVFGSQDFLTYMRNSALIAGGSTLFALALGLPAAYSIARFRQRTLSDPRELRHRAVRPQWNERSGEREELSGRRGCHLTGRLSGDR